MLDYIKVHVDRERRCGDFWLTGSQAFHMMKHVTESLAGRAGIVRLLGLSNSEICGNRFGAFTMDPGKLTRRLETAEKMSLHDVFARIYRGSMPRLYENEAVDREQYYESYLETYISRDIKNLAQVGDETAFFNFMSVVAARTATNVDYTTLAAEVGISSPTAKRWLSILVSSGIVASIQPYSSNVLKRVVKAPRMYFLDTGLCAHLTRWTSAETLERGAMGGAFFETWVVSEIFKSYLNEGKHNPPLFFYRDSNKREIDLLIYEDGTLTPIEIKKAAAPKDATRNFRVLSALEKGGKGDALPAGDASSGVKVGTGGVVCMAGDLIPIDRRNWCVPAWLI